MKGYLTAAMVAVFLSSVYGQEETPVPQNPEEVQPAPQEEEEQPPIPQAPEIRELRPRMQNIRAEFLARQVAREGGIYPFEPDNQAMADGSLMKALKMLVTITETIDQELIVQFGNDALERKFVLRPSKDECEFVGSYVTHRKLGEKDYDERTYVTLDASEEAPALVIVYSWISDKIAQPGFAGAYSAHGHGMGKVLFTLNLIQADNQVDLSSNFSLCSKRSS